MGVSFFCMHRAWFQSQPNSSCTKNWTQLTFCFLPTCFGTPGVTLSGNPMLTEAASLVCVCVYTLNLFNTGFPDDGIPRVPKHVGRKQCVDYVSFLGAFPKLRKAFISFFISVRPHGTTRLPLDGFSWNLIFEDFFSKICRENSSFVKIGQE